MIIREVQVEGEATTTSRRILSKTLCRSPKLGLSSGFLFQHCIMVAICRHLIRVKPIQDYILYSYQVFGTVFWHWRQEMEAIRVQEVLQVGLDLVVAEIGKGPVRAQGQNLPRGHAKGPAVTPMGKLRLEAKTHHQYPPGSAFTWMIRHKKSINRGQIQMMDRHFGSDGSKTTHSPWQRPHWVSIGVVAQLILVDWRPSHNSHFYTWVDTWQSRPL